MSDSDDFCGGFIMAFILMGFLCLAFWLGYQAGEYSMRSDCAHYGKFIDNQETYICEKQK